MSDESSEWTLVAEISNDFDLGFLLSELNARNLSYRLHRTEACVELWVEFSDDVPRVMETLEQIQYRQKQQSRSAYLHTQSFQEQLYNMPVVVALLLLSFLGTALVMWWGGLVHWFSFQDFIEVGGVRQFDTVSNAIEKGEYWRFITPIFLHFDRFHIIFNGLFLWVFGQKIEHSFGSFHILVTVLLIALASNLGQYLWGGAVLFGGMSGVVYGLFGYLWFRQKIAPKPELALPSGLLVMMLFILALGMSGIVELMTSKGIANAAHAVGLVTGMILGGWAGYSETKAPAP